MLARYLKAQLVVLLCGGLVGPIFLVVYFTLGLGSLLQWMFYVGLLITVADVLIALALANYGAKSSEKLAALEQNGVLALAQITGITETGTWVNNQQVVKVHLHIAGPGLVPAQFTVAEDNTTYDLSGQGGPLMESMQIIKANNIPLNRMVDIRSNPALRAQIQAVVRRAAQQQAPAGQHAPAGQPATGQPSAPVAAPPGPSIAARLQELNDLHASGALTEQEYNSRRAAIIAEI